MRHSDTTFFCGKGHYPRAHLASPPSSPPWPIAVKLGSGNFQHGEVLFFFADESDFTAFKNSILEVYNKYREAMGYDK